MFRVAAATSVLCLIAAFTPAAAHESSQRVASPGLDIPGLTYPRAAPPDLVAIERPAEIDLPDAVTPGAVASAGEAPGITLKLKVNLAEITMSGSAVVAKAAPARQVERRRLVRMPASTAANTPFPWTLF